MIHAWLNSSYRLVRRTPVVLEGLIPVTQSVSQTFESPVLFTAVAHGISLPLTVTIVGDTSEELVISAADRYVGGLQEFNSVQSVFTTVGSTSGHIELRVIGSDGNPREFEKTIETGKAYFVLQGTPVAFLGHGRIVRSEAGLIKLDGETAVEKDLIHVTEDNENSLTGTTYSVLRARRITTIQQQTLHQFDLHKQGIENLGDVSF